MGGAGTCNRTCRREHNLIAGPSASLAACGPRHRAPATGEGQAEQGEALGSDAPGSRADAAFYRAQPLARLSFCISKTRRRSGLVAAWRRGRE